MSIQVIAKASGSTTVADMDVKDCKDLSRCLLSDIVPGMHQPRSSSAERKLHVQQLKERPDFPSSDIERWLVHDPGHRVCEKR